MSDVAPAPKETRFFGRLMIRLIVVPLGVALALAVAVIVVIIGQWRIFLDALAAQPDPGGGFLALVVYGPWIALVLAYSTMLMLSPAAIGILAAEAFAIRSWLYHVGNGMISGWIGWALVESPHTDDRVFANPKLIVVAGLIAGLIYWLIAGSSAGPFGPRKAAQPAETPR